MYAIKECPYIPAYEKLVAGDIHEDEELLRFAKRYNEKRGHEYIYWNLSDIDSL